MEMDIRILNPQNQNLPELAVVAGLPNFRTMGYIIVVL
jgi:hypothetical protein